MSSYKVQLTGLNQVQKTIKDLGEKVNKQILNEFKAFGTNVVRDAKALAPVDEGHLKNSISYTTEATGGNTIVEIHVVTDYAAYVEFGTRSFAVRYVSSLPADWQTFAAQYQGKGGGSFAEMVERLTRWVRLKGISGRYAYVTKKPKRLGSKQVKDTEDYNTAYIIALSILKKGIKAHPFLFPAVEHNKKELIAALNNMFK